MVRNGGQDTKNQGLLQLSKRDQHNPEVEIEFGEDSAAGDEHVPANSVITQVTTREQAWRPPSAPSANKAAQTSWRNRLRAVLCCFAPPASDQYYRPEPEAVVIRPPQPPAPPSHPGEAVLGNIHPQDRGKKTLVLDLDETLVHSSFKPIPNPDYIIPVEIEEKIVDVYVLKRPMMDHFMAAVGSSFEVVVFTASLKKYADPLLDLLDQGSVVRWRLFRESCYPYEGNYVKNLVCLGRDLANVIIVDNSPHSYVFQPDNALPIGTFIDDPDDRELLQILPVLKAVENVGDVRQHLGHLIASMHSNAAIRRL